MSGEYRVLLVEDSVDDALLIVRELQRGGLAVTFERIETIAAIQAALQRESWHVIICDFGLPGFDGLAVLALCRQLAPETPFIMVTGRVGQEHAEEILRAGAQDYVLKENLARLVPALNRELRAVQERRIHKQMAATQAYLASIVECCDDAIIGTTLDGTVLSWNAGAERLFGYAASEMLGRSISCLMPPARLGEVGERMEKLSRGERVDHSETVHIRKDGMPVEVLLTISPIRDRPGRIIGASAVVRDNTQHKQDENERLRLLQDLTEALAHQNLQQGPSGQSPEQPG